jgi:hypothetical protein
VCVGGLGVAVADDGVTIGEWVGIDPGTEPGEYLGGTAASFDRARDDFGEAWPVFPANRTEADFEAWRRNRAWTAWKYAMRGAGCKMATA